MCFSSTAGGSTHTHSHTRPFSILEKGKYNIPFLPEWKSSQKPLQLRGGPRTRKPWPRVAMRPMWGHRNQASGAHCSGRTVDSRETVPRARWNIKQADGKRGVVTLGLSARTLSLTSAGLTGLRNLEERGVRTLEPWMPGARGRTSAGVSPGEGQAKDKPKQQWKQAYRVWRLQKTFL